MKKFLLKVLFFYQKNISSGLYTSCIFKPTCSNYAIDALKKHNTLKAVFLIIFRLLRCNSLNCGGFDPVPDNKKVLRWLY
ncbi:MAG: membrane protein insertion efficiency factor YidD [Christensenellaceae bacterium]